MNKTDTIESKTIILTLDKPRVVRFTFQSVYILENLYGNMKTAIQNLTSDNNETLVIAVIDFLYALLGMERNRIEALLNINRFMDALQKIQLAFIQGFPDVESNISNTDNGELCDWDSLYYTGRYRLNMNDDEFWNCTPRRFFKLHYLWRFERGLEKAAPRTAFIDEIVF